MAMPENIGIIDLMLSVPNQETSNYYDFIKPLLMDEESRQMFQMPAQYMFKDIPNTGKQDDYLAYTIEKWMSLVLPKPWWVWMRGSLNLK